MKRINKNFAVIFSIIILTFFCRVQLLCQNVFLNHKTIHVVHSDSVLGDLHLKIFMEDSLEISYEILNMPNGIVIDSGKKNLQQGDNQFLINVKSLEKGMYMLKLFDGYRFPYMKTFMKI